MSRNGSGTYSLPAGNPVVTGTTISSTWANNTLNDIASALTQSIASDGQTTPTGNLPMGGYIHTGVGNATARTNYASAGQVEDGTLNYLTSVSGTNTITATAPVSMSAYVAGQTFRFIAAGANTGAVTLNLNAIGAKSLVRTDGSALVSGDIASGAAVQVFYDGTNFQLLNDANGQSETVTTLTATTKVVTPQVGSSSGSFTIQSANTTAITVDSSQNVGIGTSSVGTATKLQVAGRGIFTGGASDPADGSPAGVVLGYNTASSYGFIQAIQTGVATKDLYIQPTGTSSVVIAPNGGNVGIGTSAPSVKLNVSDGTVGMQMNPSGSVGYYGTITNHPVAFSVNGSERMRIDSSGNVLIGTSSTISGSTSPLQTYSGVASNQCWTAQNAATSGNRFFAYLTAGSGATGVGSIYYNGTVTVYSTTSDQRLKENIVYSGSGLEKLSNVKIRAFDWKESGNHTDFGVIAQELKEVAPECVENGEDNEDGTIKRAMSVDTSILVPAMIKAIQELSAKVTALEAQLGAK